MTVAIVEDELPAITAFANRKGWQPSWTPQRLLLVFTGRHPRTGETLMIEADVERYRTFPPIWKIFVAREGQRGMCIPNPGKLPNKIGSIFHTGNNVICAPFNRLAYKCHGGPHADWSGPENWLNVVQPGQVRESEIAGMLSTILLHLQYSEDIKYVG